jgi:hypothetical protein
MPMKDVIPQWVQRMSEHCCAGYILSNCSGSHEDTKPALAQVSEYHMGAEYLLDEFYI